MSAEPLETSEFDAPVIFVPSVDSTNNYAAKLIDGGEVSHGTVILAGRQVSGRGQRNSQWVSDEKGRDLTCSVVLLPRGLPVGRHSTIGQVAALAVLDTLKEFGISEGSLKWPNDVLVNDRKISGILVEAGVQGELVEHLIVGVGLNIGSKQFPAGVDATSITVLSGSEPPVRDVLLRFCANFKTRFDGWIVNGPEQLEAIEKVLWRRGIRSRFSLHEEEVIAKPLAINWLGHLVVELENGAVESFGTEHLRHLKD